MRRSKGSGGDIVFDAARTEPVSFRLLALYQETA
jgi:hypothetical protein